MISLEELKAARNPETGYFHDTAAISIYENFLFAFGLTRTKTQEGVILAKEIFEKLYLFQTQSGLFPRFMHEFPAIFEPHPALQIAHLLRKMIGELASIIAPEFIQKTEAVLGRLHGGMAERGCRKTFYPPSTALFEESVLKGEAVDPLFRSFWHENLATYVGPCYQEYYEADVPEMTLFDFAYGEGSRKASLALRLKALVVGVQPYNKGPFPREVEKEEYALFLEEHSALSLIRKGEDHPRYHQKGFSFLRHLEKGEKTIHSLTLSKGRIERFNWVTKNPRRCTIDLLSHFDQADPGQAVELSFFLDQASVLPRKTIFSMGEPIEIRMGEKKKTLLLEVVEGTGDFCLHALLAKRPSEKKEGVVCKELVLRTLRRSERCSLNLSLL